MAKEIVKVPLEYKTFQGEMLPRIGVYYIFRNFSDKGICREFKADISRLAAEKKLVILPGHDYEFISESSLLDYLTKHKTQSLKTQAFDGISFRDLSLILAEIHFRSFTQKYQNVLFA